MGKKSSSSNGGGVGEKGKAARAFVLKVAMHCHCNGCTDKIRGAVKDLALLQGVEAVDQSAVETKGEVKLLATADPEKLRQRLHKATRKTVDLVLLPTNPKETAPKADRKNEDLAADAQALLVDLQRGQYGQGAWANQLLPGGGWYTGNYGATQAYPPWGAGASSSSNPAAVAAAAWGPYAYPPPAQGQGHGAYYGGAPAWHTHGHGY